MVAEIVELIGVETGLVRRLQSLTQFQVEDREAQPIRGEAIFLAGSQPDTVSPALQQDRRLLSDKQVIAGRCHDRRTDQIPLHSSIVSVPYCGEPTLRLREGAVIFQ